MPAAAFSAYTVLDPSQRRALPEVGGSSHLSEHNQGKTPRCAQRAALHVILDYVKLTILIHHHTL